MTNPLFDIIEFYRSPSNISVVFADNRPEININPDHYERWLHKTGRLDVITEGWVCVDGETMGGNPYTMTMEEYFEGDATADLQVYLTLHCVGDALDILPAIKKITDTYKPAV